MPDDDLKPLGQHGGARKGAGRPKKGEIREQKNRGDKKDDAVTLNSRGNLRGNSVDYIVARLRREGHLDLVEAIFNRKISAFATACALGWAKRPETLHGENCNQARRRAFDARALIG